MAETRIFSKLSSVDVLPSSYTLIQSGAVAGTTVDLLFFPIDTLKTRLQSAQGFVKAGGFKGVYKGVGSVALGSAPGGTQAPCCRKFSLTAVAAAFFTTYDTLKRNIKMPKGWEPMSHLIAASCGEVVRRCLSSLWDTEEPPRSRA